MNWKKKFYIAQLNYLVLIFVTVQGLAPLAAQAAERNLSAVNQTRSLDQFDKDEIKTLDELLSKAMEDKTSWYLDGGSSVIEFTEPLIIDPKGLPHSELLKLNSLMETGLWAENGVTYDFRNVVIVIRDGKGGLGDLMASLFSRDKEPQNIQRSLDPSLSVTQILEVLIGSLDSQSFYFDVSTKTFIVTGEIAPPGELDKRTSDAVWDILTSGEKWQAPSGQVFDFSQSPLVIKKAHQRALLRSQYELRNELQNSSPSPVLERFQSFVLMKPFTPCSRLLVNTKASSIEDH